MQREVPLFITFLTGILLLLAFFVPPLSHLEQTLLDWFQIVAGFTLILGLDSLIIHHAQKVQFRRKGWFHSAALLVSLFGTIVWGFYSWWRSGSPFAPNASFLQYYYTYIFVPLQATMFALLAFFIASAAFRAFRARTLEATLLLLSATILMLGRTPVGYKIHPAIPAFSDWIMAFPQLAAKRGIFLGMSLGAIAFSLRVILGMERSYLR